MYYEKQILPLDQLGNFILAIHFPRHKIGGECTRESSHAYFAHGHVSDPSNLTELTDLCCVDRLPNKKYCRQLKKISKVQGEMGRPAEEWQYAYQAEKELERTLHVPRTVLATRNGLLYLGIDAEIDDLEAGQATYVQRVIDVKNKTIKKEDREVDIPVGNSKIYPKCISDDGNSIISIVLRNAQEAIVAELDTYSSKSIVQYHSLYPVADFVFIDGCWISIDEKNICKFTRGTNQEAVKLKMPKKVFGWTASTTSNSSFIGFSGDGGYICIVDIDDGKVRGYYPHRGCKRDDLAMLKLSDDGKWMASKLYNNSELVITSLENGKSWAVAELNDQVIIENREGDYLSESSIPAAFNFIGTKLLVSDSNEVRVIELTSAGDQSFVSEQGKAGARIPLKLTAKNSIDTLIKQAKLDAHLDYLRDVYYPACYIRSKASRKLGWGMPGKRGAFSLGASRLGGWPDLPEGSTWPTWQQRPMAFIGQLNIEDISLAQPGIRLPKKGVLLFFLGCGTDTFEREPFNKQMYMTDLMPDIDQKNSVKVVFSQSEVALERTRYGGDILPELFSPCPVKIRKGGMPLPHELTAHYQCMPFDDLELENYNELLDYIATDDYENQISGYPAMLQSTPLEWGVENQSLGKDQFDVPKTESKLQSHNEASTQWSMLLQLTSDANADYIWGDGGHLYIYCPRAEMEQGVFDNCYAVFEW